jgi:serine/threonine protein kinase
MVAAARDAYSLLRRADVGCAQDVVRRGSLVKDGLLYEHFQLTDEEGLSPQIRAFDSVAPAPFEARSATPAPEARSATPAPEARSSRPPRAPWSQSRVGSGETEDSSFGCGSNDLLRKVARTPDVPMIGRRMRSGERIGHFRILSKLGEGGMGVVYKALDLERGQTVALKTLQRMDARVLARLKNEFRAVADVVHPNLVALHELFSIQNDWFFTMELVDGVSFLAYVRDDGIAGDDTVTSTNAAAAARELTPKAHRAPPAGSLPRRLIVAGGHRTPARPLDAEGIARLRGALPKLALGVSALHASGKVHRDLKPGNVLVTRSGRVVVLDFGLSSDASPASFDVEDDGAGTPTYMAPEQIWAPPATAASDWYAVGVMLYEALTGRPPFQGSVNEILRLKRHAMPPRPSARVEGVPADLDDLCMDLLRLKPEERPSGPVILSRLLGASHEGGRASSPDGRPSSPDSLRIGPESRAPESPRPSSDGRPSRSLSSDSLRSCSDSLRNSLEGRTSAAPISGSYPSSGPRSALLVGREPQLRALEDAYKSAQSGEVVTAFVDGCSGMGKSALVRSFLDSVRSQGEAVVLRGRCYERESVPFKAFDELIDALARYLRRLPSEAAAALLPAGIKELARIFPVLEGVPAVAEAVAGGAEVDDPDEIRRRAFRALADLFGAVASARPLVLWIDDLQWGDYDSAELLAELFSPARGAESGALLHGRARTRARTLAPARVLVPKRRDREQPDAARGARRSRLRRRPSLARGARGAALA